MFPWDVAICNRNDGTTVAKMCTGMEHRDEVMADYEDMLARDARGNPPELRAKLDAGLERFLAMVRELRDSKSREARDAGDSSGH
jgi:hypothetical protein